MNRRKFSKMAATGTAIALTAPLAAISTKISKGPAIRLGGPIFTGYENPDQWVKAVQSAGFTAAYCPVDPSAESDEIKAYRESAGKAGILISEVGTWSNPISPDEQEKEAAMEKCIAGLKLADEIGASCCVNISGSRNREKWAGPHMENLSDETFEMVVESTRKIIDAVKPSRTWFTLEAMPWAFPYSADSYLRLIRAIDRERFAVHLDPVNMVTSPEVYFNNAKMLKECFNKLGPYIRSCHAKDIIINEEIYTPHLDELRPGLGKLDYGVFLTELAKLDNVPLMMEHLDTAEEYGKAAGYIRSVATEKGLSI